MSRSDEYWDECVAEALSEADVAVTREQLQIIAGSISICAQMQGEATGSNYIPNPLSSELDGVKRKREEDKRDAEARERKLSSEAEDRIRRIRRDYEDTIAELRARLARLEGSR